MRELNEESLTVPNQVSSATPTAVAAAAPPSATSSAVLGFDCSPLA